MNKAKLGITAKSKINEANKALLQIIERKKEEAMEERRKYFRREVITINKH